MVLDVLVRDQSLAGGLTLIGSVCVYPLRVEDLTGGPLIQTFPLTLSQASKVMLLGQVRILGGAARSKCEAERGAFPLKRRIID